MTDIPEVHPHLQNIVKFAELAEQMKKNNEQLFIKLPDLPEVVVKQMKHMQELIAAQHGYIVDINEAMMETFDRQEAFRRNRREALQKRNEENERRKAERRSHAETYNPFTKD